MPIDLTVRPIDGAAEYDTFFDMAARTFIRDVPFDPAAADWRRFSTEHPGFHAEGLRAAFRGNTYVGGYIIEERWLNVGAARMRAGVIGGVVTHPDHRRQGIGGAMMWDAMAHAGRRGMRVLLLNGAAHFYDPFGYIDVFDRTDHSMARADILARPPSPYTVRMATGDDAQALLALYQRHYGPYSGSFARTLDEQAFVARFMATVDQSLYARPMNLPCAMPAIAVDPAGEPRGYLAVPWGPLRSFGCEAAADDWPAALALLQHHSSLLDALPEPPDHLRWPLPPDASALHAITDNLAVYSETRRRPHAGWMASIVDLPALVGSLLPAWRDRLRRSAATWSGRLALAVEEDVLPLAIDSGEIQLLDHPPENVITARVSRQVLTQLLFGYRPITWAAGQPDQRIAPELLGILDVLFPAGNPWIAPTDGG
jgi:GNAT superfamily N-acetyltransferase